MRGLRIKIYSTLIAKITDWRVVLMKQNSIAEVSWM